MQKKLYRKRKKKLMKLKLNRDGRSYVHKYGQKTNVNAFKLPNPNVDSKSIYTYCTHKFH